MAINYGNLSNHTNEELEKELAANQKQWWSEDDGTGLQKTEGQKQANQNNQLIHQELDKRNGTQTTYNSASGTYDIKAPKSDFDTSSSSSSFYSANQILSQNLANKPTDFSNKYDPILDDLYSQITNRGKFSYDLNADELYNQYKDQYMRNGKLAMEDTMGQTAGLTGGYGSTYSQMAGQQAYDSYLQDLNNIVPQLEQRAYDRWRDEGDDLLTQWSMVNQRLNTDYGKYQDALSDYWNGNNFYANRADQYYAQQQSEKSNLAAEAEKLMNKGFELSAEQGAALGMTAEQLQKWNDAVQGQSSGGGGYYYVPGEEDGTEDEEDASGKGYILKNELDSIKNKNAAIGGNYQKEISQFLWNEYLKGNIDADTVTRQAGNYGISDDAFNNYNGIAPEKPKTTDKGNYKNNGGKYYKETK